MLIISFYNHFDKDTILYWSIHENEVIKIFAGHTDEFFHLFYILLKHLNYSIRVLEMNPKNDKFLTTSLDKTLRLWSLES